MSSYQVKNDVLSVSVDTSGAGLTSIKDKTGLEYLWQGNPDYWSGQAPILFPICGSLRNGKRKLETENPVPWAGTESPEDVNLLSGAWTVTAFLCFCMLTQKP